MQQSRWRHWSRKVPSIRRKRQGNPVPSTGYKCCSKPCDILLSCATIPQSENVKKGRRRSRRRSTRQLCTFYALYLLLQALRSLHLFRNRPWKRQKGRNVNRRGIYKATKYFLQQTSTVPSPPYSLSGSDSSFNSFVQRERDL